MTDFYLEEHTFLCERETKEFLSRNETWMHGLSCGNHPRYFLFLIKNKFFLIRYHFCMERGDKYDFFKQIIEDITKNSNVYDKYEIMRSVNYERDFKEFRLRNVPLKKYFIQANYIYSDNAGKEYVIATKVKYMEHLVNQDELYENYKIAEKHLVDNNLLFLKNDLDRLFSYNILPKLSEVEQCKTISHLVKEINKITN